MKANIMEKQKNVMFAKKYMVESIYRSANIEGVGVTFPETQTICDGMSISGHSVDDINVVNDLKRAWQWIFQNIDEPISYETVCNLNRVCGRYSVINAGIIRDMYDEPIRVTISAGKYYYPEIPVKENMIKNISTYQGKKDIDAALDLFCYICKLQAFNDGNKRTATLVTNMFMIQNGLGILSIPVEKKLDFYNALTSYYEDDSLKEELVSFLRENCLTGNTNNYNPE
jgi:Fic family protein